MSPLAEPIIDSDGRLPCGHDAEFAMSSDALGWICGSCGQPAYVCPMCHKAKHELACPYYGSDFR